MRAVHDPLTTARLPPPSLRASCPSPCGTAGGSVRPSSQRVGRHANARRSPAACRWCACAPGIALVVFDVAPHAVQVDRVRHHRVVDEHDAQALAVGSRKGSASENFRPLNDQTKRSMCPVRCNSMSGPVRGRRGRRTYSAGRHRSGRAVRCRAGRCPDRRAATTAPWSACRPADCRARCGMHDGCPRRSRGWHAGIGRGPMRHRPWHPCRMRIVPPACGQSCRGRMPAMTHVGHRQRLGRGSSAGRRHADPGAHGEGARRETRAIHGLREDRERVLRRRARR